MAVEVPMKKLRYYWPVYLLIAVPLIMVCVFSYFPIYNGFVHIFYRWNGDTVEEFIGLGNIMRVLQDATLLHSFGVVLIFVIANVFKMIVPILIAVVLHHVISDRMGYLYRVLFVVPMIIPGMVGILIWKYFYEPNNGVLNRLLRGLGFLSPTDSIQWLSDERLIIPSLIFMGFLLLPNEMGARQGAGRHLNLQARMLIPWKMIHLLPDIVQGPLGGIVLLT